MVFGINVAGAAGLLAARELKKIRKQGELPVPPRPQFKVITICGSMRFYKRMIEIAQAYTRNGFVVLMPFVAIPPGEQIDNDTKAMLDRMHRQKIDMASAILVVSPNGYIGDSTVAEVQYARDTSKEVIYSS